MNVLERLARLLNALKDQTGCIISLQQISNTCTPEFIKALMERVAEMIKNSDEEEKNETEEVKTNIANNLQSLYTDLFAFTMNDYTIRQDEINYFVELCLNVFDDFEEVEICCISRTCPHDHEPMAKHLVTLRGYLANMEKCNNIVRKVAKIDYMTEGGIKLLYKINQHFNEA